MSVVRTADWLEELQPLITNPLDRRALQGRRVAAILGDVPSTYAKSPELWNAAFRALQVEAVYVPLDVPAGRLADVVHVLRLSEPFLGGSVTVPYKQAVIPLLDEVDPLTACIGAVNVVVRTPDGRLIGHNTDGLGGFQALVEAVPEGVDALRSARVLLIGAGGAARALAVYLWECLTKGELTLANRNPGAATALVERLTALRPGRVAAIDEQELARRVSSFDIIINATVKGQAGIRKLPDGRATMLEPYSALAPAHPAVLPAPLPGAESAFIESWYRPSLADLQQNQAESLSLCAAMPKTTICYDIIYAPLETVFLHHARWSGHRTLNGKAMNLRQAVEAFASYVCNDWMEKQRGSRAGWLPVVMNAMEEEWSK